MGDVVELKSNVLRTPDKAFSNLKDFPFQPNYLWVDGLRMHYVDEGKQNKKTIFLFHGQPTWSYLYRHMIPVLVNAGYRVIAPDLVGFGKSDKPCSAHTLTFANHVKWMGSFVEQVGVKNAAAFFQDWGGMIGLRVLAQHPQWLNRAVLANTALAQMNRFEKFLVPKVMKMLVATAGKPSAQDFDNKKSFRNWAGYFRHAPFLEIGKIIQSLTTRNLSAEELKAYDAPFPDPSFYAGPRTMPEIIATDLDGVNTDLKRLKHWSHPVLTLFSDQDPFLAGRGYDKKFHDTFSGAHGQPHETVRNASHFLQEDSAIQLANSTLNWLNASHF